METLVLPETKISSHVSQERSCYTCFETVLKPALLSLKVVGVYFDPTPATNKVGDSAMSSPSSTISRRFSWFTGRVYCYIVLLILWLNLAKSVVGLFPVDEGIAFRVILAVWHLQCALNATIMMVSCQRLRYLRSFYKHWDSLFENSTTIRMGCGFQSSRLFMRATLTIGWIFFFVNLASTYMFFFGNLQTSPLFITSFSRPFPEHNVILILAAVLHIFEDGAWVFPIIFFSILCRIIRAQFIQFGCCLAKQIADANERIPTHLQELRYRYNQLCQAVEIVNSSFKWLLGLSFMIEVLLACFISYQVINTPPDFMTIFTYCFWLFTSFLCILVLAISSSDVHDAAHCLLENIFWMGTQDSTVDQLGQLNLFVSKLTGTSIGFTAIDFFVITKEFLLTIVGLYLTYFFLLLQFKIT